MFSVINPKTGKMYYLHPQLTYNKSTTFYYFSKSPEGAIDLPPQFEIRFNSKTGLPVVKKKDFEGVI